MPKRRYKLTPEFKKRFAQQMCRALAEEVLRTGQVDPSGKSDLELQIAILEYVRDNYLGKLTHFTIDHTVDILRRARRLRDDEDYFHSCIFYATWIEHWLNGLIQTSGQRRRIRSEDLLQMVRDVPLRSKLTWLLRLLDLPPIAPKHRSSVIRLVDLRNGFVHYKWTPQHMNELGRGDDQCKDAIDKFELAVKYLQRYYTRNVYSGKLGLVGTMFKN